MSDESHVICGFRWPLLDPNDEDRLARRTHECSILPPHAPPHRCRQCGTTWPEGDRDG